MVWFGNYGKGERLEMYFITWSFSGGGGGSTLLGHCYWYVSAVSVPGGFFFVRLWMDVMD